MIRYLSITLLFLFTGCTPNHYIIKNQGTVAMYLDSPGVNEVMFVSSLDNFNVHSAMKKSGNLWVIDNLEDREFRYFYIVDGKMFIPVCRFREIDDFGTVNCIYQP